MKPVMAAAIVLLAAASANGAVGDLTLKSCDPLGGGWSASLESGQAGRPASSYIRTVNSGAKVMTLYNRASGFSILVALDSARAGGQVLDVLRIDAPGDDASQVMPPSGGKRPTAWAPPASTRLSWNWSTVAGGCPRRCAASS